MNKFIQYILSIGFEQSKKGMDDYYTKEDTVFVFGRRPFRNRQGKHDSFYMLFDPTPVLTIGNAPLMGNNPRFHGRIFELPMEEVYQRLITGKPFYFEK